MISRSDRVLRLIAAFRFANSILLFAAGLAALKLVRGHSVVQIRKWVESLPFAAQHELIQRAIAEVTRLPERRLQQWAIVLFLYATLYTIETVGLWLRKRWAEWLTIIATSLFIPFEVHAVMLKQTVVRISVLILNIAIVIFLLYRRRTLK